MTNFKFDIGIRPGVPTPNGRVYSEEVWRNAAEDYRHQHVRHKTSLVFASLAEAGRLASVVGVLTDISDDLLTGTVDVIASDRLGSIKTMWCLLPVGFGDVDAEGRVQAGYKIDFFHFYPK